MPHASYGPAHTNVFQAVPSYASVQLTIIPRARIGSELKAAEWAIDSEAMRERGIIVLVKSN